MSPWTDVHISWKMHGDSAAVPRELLDRGFCPALAREVAIEDQGHASDPFCNPQNYHSPDIRGLRIMGELTMSKDANHCNKGKDNMEI